MSSTKGLRLLPKPKYMFFLPLRVLLFKCSTSIFEFSTNLQGFKDQRTSLFCSLEATLLKALANPHGFVEFFLLNVVLPLSEHEICFQSVSLDVFLSGLPFLVPTET